MNLSRLLALGGDSPVLQALASDGDYTTSLRSLRLVSKETSRLALMGVKRFTLTLKGVDPDTNLRGASLLQNIKLSKLIVHLRLTDSYSPAPLMEAFLGMVGQALASVTSLQLHMQDCCDCTVRAAAVGQVLEALVVACPALLSILCPEGRLSSALWPVLGQRCPLLSTLHICSVGDLDSVGMQEMLRQQPSQLPNITSLILKGEGYRLPDMTRNVNIVTLSLCDFTLLSHERYAGWLCLPPKLQHLLCGDFQAGPPATLANGAPALACLLTCIVGPEAFMPLHAVAQVLSAAPALRVLECDECRGSRGITLECEMNSTFAADLLVLDGRREIEFVTVAKMWFIIPEEEDDMTFQPFIGTVPTLTGLSYCQIDFCLPANIGRLLAAFPDLRKLYVSSVEMDDRGLSAVAVGGHLEQLELMSCVGITPVGIEALCMRLPSLCYVSCHSLDGLEDPAMEDCLRNLREQGRLDMFPTWW